MRILLVTVLMLSPGVASAVAPLGACPGGKALASFDLNVQSDSDGGQTALRAVTRLDGGARVLYKPQAQFGSNGDAQVALISIPTTPTGVLGVLEARKATESAEWVIPSRAAAVALVYGPQGLSLEKISELMQRDPELIPQLAAYAEKSAQTEVLMETLAQWERSGSGQTLEAALQGFSSRYGVALPALSRGATTDQQAMTLMRALHPAIATFDPLAPDSMSRLQQSGSLAASVAGLFLGSPVGLATAGGAMFLNLRSLLFPGSEFRSALAQQMSDTTVICAKREAVKSRTKLVYLWAWKILGAPAPRLEGLPYRVNLSEANLVVPVKGANLENIRGVSTSMEGAEVQLQNGLRALSIKLPQTARKGDRLDLRIAVEDSPAPIILPGAIELLGPRPVVQSAKPSLPHDLPIDLSEGEIPANAFTAVTIRTEGLDSQPTLHVDCTDPTLTLRKLSIRPGEQAGAARLRTIAKGELFLSLEPGTVGQAPCALRAMLETADGLSDPALIGRLVRLPRIEKFALGPELIAKATYGGWIEGEELESIEKTGWNPGHGVAVGGPPVPVANHGSRQRMKIAMPWPPPAPRAPLYVWLRGENTGRKSTVVY